MILPHDHEVEICHGEAEAICVHCGLCAELSLVSAVMALLFAGKVVRLLGSDDGKFVGVQEIPDPRILAFLREGTKL